MADLEDFATLDLDRLIRFRNALHQHPELSNNEQNTAARVVEFLQETEPQTILTGLGGHGVAAIYGASNEGPTVLFRCELDALPIQEANSFKHRSRVEGVAHLCGHDGHMAIVSGLGLFLKQHPLKKGRVVLLFQPAEETGEGAAQVLADPQFTSIEPDFAFALHNLPGYEQGRIVLRDGVFASASKGLTIELNGAPSHAAHPAHGRNPSLAVSQLVQSLIAIPQMHTELHAGALITPIHVRVGGPAFGTSPGDGVVMATLRAHTAEDMSILAEKAVGIAEGIGKVYQLDVAVSWTEEFEAVTNDAHCVEITRNVAESLSLKVTNVAHPFPWSEDFGHFTAHYPGALFGVGAGTDLPQLHNNNYDFPDDLIETGVKMFYGIAERILSS